MTTPDTKTADTPKHVIAHFSDTHFLADNAPLYGEIPTLDNLVSALDRLEKSGKPVEAIVFTGDLTDLAEPDAYQRLRRNVEPVAARLGAEIIWVMGNHDERFRFATQLLDMPVTDAPQDRVIRLGGLRIIALDSTVPGYHHGELDDGQLDWLAAELATPAPDGTLLALHHPPLRTPIKLMQLIELKGRDRLADVIRNTDVRGILGGHLHYATHSTLAGIPVSVAAATCYTIDVAAPAGALSSVDGGQAFNLVELYDDSVVHSVVPMTGYREVAEIPQAMVDAFEQLTPDEQFEAFSNKKSYFDETGIHIGGAI
ncbi:3',5'-cyclic adenosine monophosphate phosphodiesterase CpdA [soil metagenome]